MRLNQRFPKSHFHLYDSRYPTTNLGQCAAGTALFYHAKPMVRRLLVRKVGQRNVGGGDGGHVPAAERLHVHCKQARRLRHFGAFHHVAGKAAVAEVTLRTCGLKDMVQLLAGVLGEGQALLLGNQPCNIAQVTGAIVGKGNVEGDAGAQAGFCKKLLHLVGVAREDDDQYVAVAFPSPARWC